MAASSTGDGHGRPTGQWGTCSASVLLLLLTLVACRALGIALDEHIEAQRSKPKTEPAKKATENEPCSSGKKARSKAPPLRTVERRVYTDEEIAAVLSSVPGDEDLELSWRLQRGRFAVRSIQRAPLRPW